MFGFLHKPEKLVDYEHPYRAPEHVKPVPHNPKEKSKWFYYHDKFLYAGDHGLNAIIIC